MPLHRRAFLKTAGLAGLGICVAGDIDQAQPPVSDIWTGIEPILRRIVPPVFPDRTFDVTKFGAVAQGAQDCSDAFRRAISACHAAGGGRVVVPGGRFLTGAIRLRSGVNLHLEDGATIAFRTEPSAYLPLVLTRFESTELMNYSPFIYALDERDVAITGTGTLDGQANESNWWAWRAATASGPVRQTAGRTRLLDLGARRVPVSQRVFGEGSYLRPNFIQPYRCHNVLIEGVTIVNSPMWEINPVLSSNVTIRGVNVRSLGPNNDGCDPESCRDVLIEGCTFATGDDCIALKSGRNEDGRRIGVPIENVIIRNCQMRDGHGGVVIGSEISGGARNIFAEDCRMDSPRLDRVLRFKTNSMRGGVIERVAMRRVTVGEVAEGIIVADFFYEEGDSGPFTPILREVDVRDVTSRKSKYAFLLRGYRRSPVTDIRVTNCTFDGVGNDDVLDEVRDLVLTDVRVNGRVLNERITHQAQAALK